MLYKSQNKLCILFFVFCLFWKRYLPEADAEVLRPGKHQVYPEIKKQIPYMYARPVVLPLA